MIEQPMITEELIKQCGQSIINNAASILGSEKYMSDLTVSIYLSPTEAPRINVDRNFFPEQFIGNKGE